MTMFEQVRERLRSAPTYGMFLTDVERLALDCEIEEVLKAIRNCATMDLAEAKLEELGLMQHTLAIVAFKYRVELSEKQDRLVREYDRWDDRTLREETFEAIRNGQFP